MPRLFEPDAVVADLVAAGLAVEVLDGYPADRPVTPPPGLVGLPGPQTGLNAVPAGRSDP